LKWVRKLKELCDKELSIASRPHDLDRGSYHNIVLTFISLCQLRLLAGGKYLQELEPFAESLHKDGKSHSRSVMKTLDAFASNPWFDRIWVIQ
jgi:hypothetical protein